MAVSPNITYYCLIATLSLYRSGLQLILFLLLFNTIYLLLTTMCFATSDYSQKEACEEHSDPTLAQNKGSDADKEI